MPSATRAGEWPQRLLWVTGCLSEWVSTRAGVPQIAADLLRRQIPAALGQQRTPAPQQRIQLFDQLVRADQDGGGEGESKRFCHPSVDDQLQEGGLLNRDVAASQYSLNPYVEGRRCSAANSAISLTYVSVRGSAKVMSA